MARSITGKATPVFACDDFSVLRRLALAGLGITQLPDYMCAEFEDRGQLIRVLPDWSGARVDFYTIVPSRRGVTPKVRAFLDYLVEVVGQQEASAIAQSSR